MLINYLLKVPQPLKLNRKLSHVQRMKQSTHYIYACDSHLYRRMHTINQNEHQRQSYNRPESGGFSYARARPIAYILCTLEIKISYRIIHKKYAHVRLLFIKAHIISAMYLCILLLILMMIMVPRTKRKHGPVGSQRAHNQ